MCLPDQPESRTGRGRCVGRACLHSFRKSDRRRAATDLNHPKRIVSIDRHDKSYRGNADSCQTTKPAGILAMAIHKTNSRGKDTRSRLLSVATQLFSDRGYEGVSTREISAAANTTLPAIPHHFGSKDGIYQAVS